MLKSRGCDTMTGTGRSFSKWSSESRERNGLAMSDSGRCAPLGKTGRKVKSMPVCIYCLKTASTEKFSKEHVLTRAFSGSGENWTLVDTVCGECNVLFSAFETHWTHNAIESVMRNFSGPVGRSKKSKNKRMQPTEIDHLYIIQRNDPLVYESGFSFPNEFYFRPQIIENGGGLLSLAADQEDAAVLQSAINDLLSSGEVELCRPIDGKKTFKIAKLSVDVSGKRWSVDSERVEDNPQGYWIRCYPDPPEVKGIDGIEGHLTPRCAVDDKKRIYFRVERSLEVAKLLDDLLQGKKTSQQHPSVNSPDDQTMALRVQIKLPLVYRAVLKTGLNMVAHLADASMARDTVFNDLRSMVLDKQADNEVMKRCNLLNDSSQALGRAGFPPPVDSGQHRLMLDIFRGNLCFRMRLYGHLGYECVLAPATADIQSAISTARVVVDFDSTGIRKVVAWP